MSFGRIHRMGILLGSVALLGVVGCSSKVARTVDVSGGEYYTAEEFKSLSTEQRDAYCATLDQELQQLGSAKADAEREGKSLQSDLQSAQSEIRTLQGRYDAAEAEVGGLQEQIDYFEGLPTVYVVKDGDFLRKISAYEEIYADEMKWPRIYRANKSRIEDPNLIYPGWELTIPRDWPMSWTVKQDEYLSRIASYWEVYGDGTEWPKIFEANRDRVSDADMIWPDWELTIPRQ